MKAYALVQGPRRKVLFVSDSCPMLWYMGSAAFEKHFVDSDSSTRFDEKYCRNVCKANDAYIVRIEFELGDPITTPRKRHKQRPA